MAKFDSILDTIGGTPMVHFHRLTKGLEAELLFKLESFNPLGSVKDRIAFSMVSHAEKRGDLKLGMRLIEPTSGNTGIGLAFVCAAKGYPLTLVMPETMSMERRQLLIMLGAELLLTPGPLGMKGAIAKSMQIFEEARAKGELVFMPRQFENPDNPLVHLQTTAEEIWTDTEGKVDQVICGVGTGGTLTGVGRVLKERKSSVKMIAVEPSESPVISGGAPGPHKIQGIGGGFIPANLDMKLVDGVERISSEEALTMAKRVIREEGVPIGISGGAAVLAALRRAELPESRGQTIVVILASQTERYLSTPLGEEAREKARNLTVSPVSDALLQAVK